MAVVEQLLSSVSNLKAEFRPQRIDWLTFMLGSLVVLKICQYES
jgi:hypothetical protein